jgi:hypothetical protein
MPTIFYDRCSFSMIMHLSSLTVIGMVRHRNLHKH